jgi:hypothetical protein
LKAAYEAAEAASQYDIPENNHEVFALMGVIALRQGNIEGARASFSEAVAKADAILALTAKFYNALDAKGMALCGLALCSVADRDSIKQAVVAFRAARAITKSKGTVGRLLKLFDVLAMMDTVGLLKEVRAAAAGEG